MIKSFPRISELVNSRVEIHKHCFFLSIWSIRTLKLSSVILKTSTANFQRPSTACEWRPCVPGTSYGKHGEESDYITLGVFRRLKQSLGFVHTAFYCHRQCLICEQEKGFI